MLHQELKSNINKLWDRFWSGGISNPLQAIEQMSYLIFMKRLEDEDISREQKAKLTERNLFHYLKNVQIVNGLFGQNIQQIKY